ncbi:MAG: 4Fe-4S dicluster domain-containing protein [Alistipes sp.]|nr:4Fe-4S dicluster domain-containing protein [Alistipes sp.]
MSKKRKIYNPLRIVRIIVAMVCLALALVAFADWGNGTPAIDGVHRIASAIARWQFIPALLSISITTVTLILLVTLFFGRIYCSTICPLGVAQDGVNALRNSRSKAAATRFAFRKADNILRYTILAITAIGIAIGAGALVALLDPYSIFGRIIYDGLRPVVQAINNSLALTVGDTFGRETISISWLSSLIALTTMLAIGAVAWLWGRRYCNSFCPVGTLLGEVSRVALMKVKIDTSKCNSCGLCAHKCKSECIDPATRTIDPTRCVVCFDCIDNCAQKAISFSPIEIARSNTQRKHFEPERNSNSADMSRGKFLSSMAIAATLPLSQKVLAQGKHNGKGKGGPRPVAPPGAGSLSNLHAKCTACHLCVSKCPTHVLQPAVTEYGLQGVMQPVMRYDKGYCLYDCTLCGEVCPTGAINLLDSEEKKMTFIGHAVFHRERCIVSVDGVECGNCAEHCPAEAIKMVKSPIDRRTYPEIEKALCIGCGRCEYLCPAKPKKAIEVKGYKTHK